MKSYFFRSVHLILWPQKQEILGVVREVKIGVAERIEGRDRVRLKGNDESESLRAPELARNRQKKQKLLLLLLLLILLMICYYYY